jgi:shikimate dehydrogenase
MRGGGDVYLKGYNTDVYGFEQSLKEWFATHNAAIPEQALILGAGGASKAVVCALSRLGVHALLVSRREGKGTYKTYDRLNACDMAASILIVNATPLGMYPDVDGCPPIPYRYITEKHFLYDLVYNPAETLFMRMGSERGACVRNGERMLHLQADRAWDVWSSFLID